MLEGAAAQQDGLVFFQLQRGVFLTKRLHSMQTKRVGWGTIQPLPFNTVKYYMCTGPCAGRRCVPRARCAGDGLRRVRGAAQRLPGAPPHLRAGPPQGKCPSCGPWALQSIFPQQRR